MKVHTISFGCQMAVADSQEMGGALAGRGFAATPELDDADAVLVNTCTVREHAEHRAISQIGRLRAWKEARPDRFVIVAGCAAERMKATLQQRFPHVDLVVGAKSIDDFPAILDEALRQRFDGLPENFGNFENTTEAQGPLAYVTIMRGCNYSCTYCIVPAVRGREVYIPLERVLEQVRAKVAGGAKEVMLLGQTVNSWKSEGQDFADLLRAVDSVEGLERVRFISPHPYFLNARMIAAMAECAKVCEHLHLPVQSGSDRMLKNMRRNYTRAQYMARVAELRRAVPGIAVTTDIIVGFPGETEEDFAQSLSLMDEMNFDAAFCFKYSPRAGTDAAAMTDDVPEAVKQERLERVLERIRASSARRTEALSGSKAHVLVEAPGLARTRTNRLSRVPDDIAVGVFTEVVL